MNPPTSIINHLLQGFLLLLGITFLVSVGYLLSLDYEEFTIQALSIAEKPNWKTYFQSSIFPANRFLWLKTILPCLAPFYYGLLWVVYQKSSTISNQIYQFGIRTRDILSACFYFPNKSERLFIRLLFLLFATRGIWQLYHYELQYDEAWTYNHFISKGFLVSAISPNNNHILYTLFASLFDWLPIASKYAIRLPIWLGGLFFSGIFYGILRRHLGWKLALVAISCFIFSPAISFYSLYARGYIFQIGFTLIAWGALWRLIDHSPSKNYYWSVWTIANILGIYSVPTHFYAWLGLNLVTLPFLIFFSQLSVRKWIIANISIVACCILLFAPLLVTNGLTILVHAASGQTVIGESFWEYQNRVSDWLLIGGGRGTLVYPAFCLLILLSLGFVYYYRNNPNQLFPAVSCLMFLSLPTLVGSILGGHTPYRAWCFLTIFIVLLPPLIIHTLRFYRYVNSIAFVVGLAGILFTGWRSEVHYFIHWSENLDREAIRIANVLLEHEVDTCYFFSNYDKPLLVYYFKQKQRHLSTPMAFPTSKDYRPFLKEEIQYPAVLWDKDDYQATTVEKEWIEEYYPTIWYKNERIEIRAPN